MRGDGDDRLSEEELRAGDKAETEEGGAAHRAFWIVEEAEYAGVVEFMRILVNEEVACATKEVSRRVFDKLGGSRAP